MAATERIVVLMSPIEKRDLDIKAVRAGQISAGELVRRALDAYDENAVGEAAELRELLGMLATLRTETLRQLDATERKLDSTLAYLDAGGEAT